MSASSHTNLRRVFLFKLGLRDFRLALKAGLSAAQLSQSELWIEVQEGKAISFWQANGGGTYSLIASARKGMLGFRELVAAFVRAANATALGEKPFELQLPTP